MQIYNGSVWTNMVGGAAAAADLTPRVTIGTQVWTTKNLSVANYRDGTPIPKITDNATWAALTTGAWCWHNNDSATYAATYGRLYNFYAVAGVWNEASKTDVSQRKQLAPSGYHIPTDGEWTTLENSLGGAGAAGGAMKEAGTDHWASPNTNATNSSGFSGLAGGFRESAGPYDMIGPSGNWWSSTQTSSANALARYLMFIDGSSSRGNISKRYGLSVRCLRD